MKPIYLMDTCSSAVLIDLPFASFKLNRNGSLISLHTDGRTFNLCKMENVEREYPKGSSIVRSETGSTPVEDLAIVLDELLYCNDEGTEIEFTYDDFKCVRFNFETINARKVLVYLLGIAKSNGLDISKLVYQTNVTGQETKKTSITEDLVRTLNDATNAKRMDPYIRSRSHKMRL